MSAREAPRRGGAAHASNALRRRSDEAWVLATHELGDNDLIVTLFTRHAGQVRGVAAGARRSRRRYGGALEPLTRVRAAWVEREGRELHRLEGLEPIRSYAGMQAEPVVQAGCAVLADIARATVREEQADPRMFRLMGVLLDAMEQGLPVPAALRYFEFWTLLLNGLLPDLDHCGGCLEPWDPRSRRWASASDGLLCARCRRRTAGVLRELTAEDRAFLRAARTSPPEAITPLTGAARPGGAVELLLRGMLEAFLERSPKTYRYLDAFLNGR